MVKEKSLRVQILVNELYQQNHIDDMTNKWLSLTTNPPRVPVFYSHAYDTQQTPVLAAEDLEIQDVFALSQ